MNSLEAKIVVLGAQGVGKTTLVWRFVKGAFAHHVSTVGASFLSKKVVDDNTDTTIRLQIWDTAGQERFHSMARMYYRGADACILCYSITDEKSFEEMGNWLTEIRQYLPLDVIIHVVGTKGDVVEKDPTLRKVPFERCIAYVAENLHPNEGFTPPATAMTGLSGTMSALSSSFSTPFGGGGYFGMGRERESNTRGGDDSGAKSPSSKRSSGFWTQDVGWDSCHEVSAETGEGVDEVFRVVSRKLVDQARKKAERERLAQLGLASPDSEYFSSNRPTPGSFRVGRDRRSWYGVPESWTNGIDVSERRDEGRADHDSRGRKGKKCC